RLDGLLVVHVEVHNRDSYWSDATNGEQVQCHRSTISSTTRGKSLACIIDSAGLTDHRHLDLAGILQALLDLLRDIASQVNAANIVVRVRLDHDAHLTTGLDREGPLDSGERRGDCLQGFQPFDIQVERLAPCAGPPARNRIDGLYQKGLDRLWLFVVMMR